MYQDLPRPGNSQDRRTIATLEGAILDALTSIGKSHQLAPLAWEFIMYPDGMVIEGRSITDTAEPTRNCERWAEVLGMQEYRFEFEAGLRTWHLEHDQWRLELRSN